MTSVLCQGSIDASTTFEGAMAGSLSDGLKSAAKSALCQGLNAAGTFGDSVVYAYQTVTGIPVNPPNFAAIAAGLLCGDPKLPPVPGNENFTGGQCNCVRYSVTATLTVSDRDGLDAPRKTTLNSTIQVWGEIIAVTTKNIPAGTNTTTVQLIVKSRGNANIVSCGAIQDVVSATATAFKLDSASVSSVSVTRIGGGADNCGNPSPTVKPYNPLPPVGLPPIRVPFKYSPNITVPGVEVNVVGNVILFQPKIGIDANIRVPITIKTDINVGGVNLEFNAVANLSTGDINFNFGGGRNDVFDPATGDCDDFLDFDDTVPDVPPTAPPKPPDPDPAKKRIMVGVLVTVTAIANGKVTTIAQSTNPTIYAPALGFINFFCEVGLEKKGGWTTDIPVKNVRQLILCPWEEGAVSVEGTPNPGNGWVLSPIYRQIKGDQK